MNNYICCSDCYSETLTERWVRTKQDINDREFFVAAQAMVCDDCSLVNFTEAQVDQLSISMRTAYQLDPV